MALISCPELAVWRRILSGIKESQPEIQDATLLRRKAIRALIGHQVLDVVEQSSLAAAKHAAFGDAHSL